MPSIARADAANNSLVETVDGFQKCRGMSSRPGKHNCSRCDVGILSEYDYESKAMGSTDVFVDPTSIVLSKEIQS
jgi:hypothetical protein